MDGKEEGTEDFNEIIALYSDMGSCRYLNTRDPIPQSDGIRNLLQQFPDHTLKQIVRCNKTNFARIVDFIKDDPIFSNNSLLSQYFVEIHQVMVSLNRLGCDGNKASIGALGRIFGNSTGTVINFTNRIFWGLKNLRDQIIFSPNEGFFLLVHII